MKEATAQVLIRGNKLCNFVEWKEYKLIYKRQVPLKPEPAPGCTLLAPSLTDFSAPPAPLPQLRQPILLCGL